MEILLLTFCLAAFYSKADFNNCRTDYAKKDVSTDESSTDYVLPQAFPGETFSDTGASLCYVLALSLSFCEVTTAP